MTHKDFIIDIQKYYGVYENEVVRADVYNFILKNYQYESWLIQLLDNIKKHFSTKWKSQPDIAIIIETEKAYPVKYYINGLLQIPEEEKKQLPSPDDREDFSQLISGTFDKIIAEKKRGMKEIRKGIMEEEEAK